jgi:hypothetical protein
MTAVTVPIKDNEKPPTFGWLMIDKKPLQELQQLAMKFPTAMGTLLYLVNNMSRSNALMTSQDSLAKALKASPRAIRMAVATLEQHNYIQVVKVGTSNVYVVNTRVAWQGRRGARFAHFNADILAFETEQRGADIDNMPPLKRIPQPDEGERLLVGNEPIDPPDQQEMLLP